MADGLERQHVALGRAVLHRARATGALGDVAADRRLLQARGIGGIEQATRFDRLLQVARDDVGLDDREEILFVDLEDAIEAFHREQHTAEQRDCPAGIPGPGAADDQRNAMLVAESRDRGDVCRRAGKQNDVRWMADLQRVTPVGLERTGIAPRVLAADNANQGVTYLRIEAHVGILSRRQSAGGYPQIAQTAQMTQIRGLARAAGGRAS